MKTPAVLLLVPVIAFSSVPGARADEAEILRRLEAIEKRLDAMETENPMQRLLQQGAANLKKKQEEADAKADMAPAPPSFSVAILGIKSGGADILGKPTIAIRMAVTNEGNRDTDIINAAVNLTDRAGNLLLRVAWPKNKGIAAGKTLPFSGTYSAGWDSSKIEAAIELDRSLLSAEFEVYKIAFTGGEVVEYKQCLMCDW